jgi:arylsulfatase A-like enzyme
MHSRAFGRRRLGALFALSLGLALLAGCPAPPSGPPNLLIISVDTLRADRIGAYGYEHSATPTTDQLAAEGVVFADASTPLPRTTQAFASLFTSRSPRVHGVLEVGERMANAELTLAEILREAGYHTLGVTGNGIVDRDQGFDQGFERFVGVTELRKRFADPGGGRHRHGKAEAVTLAAIDLLGEVKDGPYFLWVHYKDPHWVYAPPRDYVSPANREGLAFYKHATRWKPVGATIFFNLNGEAARWRPKLSPLYDDEIHYVDAMMGRLLAAVRTRSDARHTLIVFTSDHGESLGEHGYYYEHGDFVYQATIRVPLILTMPGRIPGGRTIATPVTLLDVYPTVLSLLGVALPEPTTVEGLDLSGLLTGSVDAPAPEKRLLFAQSGSSLLPQNPIRLLGGRRSGAETFRYLRRGPWVLVHTGTGSRLYRAPPDRALQDDVAADHPRVVAELERALERVPILADRWWSVREGRWKLIRIPEPDGPRYELYDLVTDSLEAKDLSRHHPEILARLSSELDRHLAEMPTVRAPEPRSSEEQRRIEARLRSLGYIE